MTTQVLTLLRREMLLGLRPAASAWSAALAGGRGEGVWGTMGPPLLEADILGDLGTTEGDLGTMEPPLEVADILGDLGAEAGDWARPDRGMSATWPHEILCWGEAKLHFSPPASDYI